MILYMVLLKVGFPTTLKMFYSILVPLVTMDIMPSEYTTELVFDFSEEEDEPVSDKLQELGFETHNVVLNMGTLFVLYFL